MCAVKLSLICSPVTRGQNSAGLHRTRPTDLRVAPGYGIGLGGVLRPASAGRNSPDFDGDRGPSSIARPSDSRHCSPSPAARNACPTSPANLRTCTSGRRIPRPETLRFAPCSTCATGRLTSALGSRQPLAWTSRNGHRHACAQRLSPSGRPTVGVCREWTAPTEYPHASTVLCWSHQ